MEEPIADGSALMSVRDRDFCAGRPLVRIWERKFEKKKKIPRGEECVQKHIKGALKHSYVKPREGKERNEESEKREVKRPL